MSELFLKIVNMGISASWLVLVVLVLRLVLKEAPKWVDVLLWSMVAFRLICPITFESPVSLMNVDVAQEIADDILYTYVGPGGTYWDHTEEYQEAVESGIEPIYGGEGHYYVLTGETPTTEIAILADRLAWCWLAGMSAMAIYTAGSYLSLRRKLRTAVILRGNVFQCESVQSPFVLGIIRPRIYLPYNMDSQDLEHVVAHERAHLRRKDHWWKPLGFLLLTIHWFNPLMWLAYILLCKDIELACDEKVIKEMGNEQRADYTQALVACSVNHRRIAACPLAFGEVGVKERVKSVMNYKKPAFWVIVISVIVCVVVAVCFLTNPKERVQDLMRPGTAWICEEHQLFFTIDEDNVIEGTFSNQNENTTISVGYRFAGKYNAVFDIYRGDWESAQKSSEAPLLAGMLKAQNGTLVLEVEQDSVGLGVKQIVFSETDAELSDISAATAGKTYLYEKEGIMGSFTITLYDDGTFTYYEGMASSYLGDGTWKQEGDIITMTDDGPGGYGLVNHFKYDGDNLIFVAEDSSNFVYVKVQDGERFRCTGEAFQHYNEINARPKIEGSRQLTLEDVVELSSKGYELTWRDFEEYYYYETGSGLYIRVYEIDEMYSLWIGGSWTDHDPMYIYLALADDMDTRIDIRDGGVTEFIEKDHSETLLNRAIYDAIINCNRSEKTLGLNHCASFVLLDKEEISGTPVAGSTDHVGEVTVYGLALHQGFDLVDNKLQEVLGSHTPVAITFDVNNGKYSLKEYWRPGDGTYYVPDIRDKFPDEIEDDAMDTQKYILAQKQHCYAQAVEYNGVDTVSTIEQLFKVIESSPAHSSRPGDYINEHPIEYRELTYYGEYTLRYCFEQFLQGGQDGLRGHLMAEACRDVARSLWPRALIGDAPDGLTGQECFNQYKANVLQLKEQIGAEELAEQYPDAGLLLEIMGESASQQFKRSTVQIVEPDAAVREAGDDFGITVPDEWLERDSGMTAPAPGEDVDPDFSIPTDNGITEDIVVVPIPEEEMEDGAEN